MELCLDKAIHTMSEKEPWWNVLDQNQQRCNTVWKKMADTSFKSFNSNTVWNGWNLYKSLIPCLCLHCSAVWWKRHILSSFRKFRNTSPSWKFCGKVNKTAWVCKVWSASYKAGVLLVLWTRKIRLHFQKRALRDHNGMCGWGWDSTSDWHFDHQQHWVWSRAGQEWA